MIRAATGVDTIREARAGEGPEARAALPELAGGTPPPPPAPGHAAVSRGLRVAHAQARGSQVLRVSVPCFTARIELEFSPGSLAAGGGPGSQDRRTVPHARQIQPRAGAWPGGGCNGAPAGRGAGGHRRRGRGAPWAAPQRVATQSRPGARGPCQLGPSTQSASSCDCVPNTPPRRRR